MTTSRRDATAPQHQTARRASRLASRPGEVRPGAAPPAGLRSLGLARGRDALLLVPPQAVSAGAAPSPLVVMLHGSGGRAAHALEILGDGATAHGALLLAPDARADTWDVLRRGFGPDVRFLDRALERVFAAHAVDPRAVILAGFSDGASYALSLGLGNGDLFTHLVAFAPGFATPEAQVGTPPIFVTHGVADRILPIDACSRLLVPRLRAAGYAIDYREFAGGHVVPPGLADEALAWALGPPGVERAEASAAG